MNKTTNHSVEVGEQVGVMNENKTNEKRIWKGRLPNPEYLPLKKCKTCGEIKTIDEFHKNNRMHDGHLAQCKTCQTKQVMEYHQTPEGKEVLKKALQKYSQSPRGKFTYVKSQHKIRGGGKITMTRNEFVDLMENQTSCAICGEKFSNENRPFTDHIISIENEEGKPSPLSVENIQLLCNSCSSIKYNRTLTQEDILAIKMSKMMKDNHYE